MRQIFICITIEKLDFFVEKYIVSKSYVATIITINSYSLLYFVFDTSFLTNSRIYYMYTYMFSLVFHFILYFSLFMANVTL